MKLGGFVIHGDDVSTLPRCLESLLAVTDVVVAVDSGTSGYSHANVRKVQHAWKGYGSARAAAVRALSDCDWVLYLDSDEWLEDAARDCLRGWRKQESAARAHLLPVHDWAELPTGRFLYRTHHRCRLVRRAAATWSDDMIVHEALSQRGAVHLDAPIEHRFATDIPKRGKKEELYSLLWALRGLANGWRLKPAWMQRPAIFFRDAFLKGAAFRGGISGIRLAWAVARYHSRKYERLGELRAGQHPQLAQSLRESDYARVFDLSREIVERAASS